VLEGFGKDGQMQYEEHLTKISYNVAKVLVEKKRVSRGSAQIARNPTRDGSKGLRKRVQS